MLAVAIVAFLAFGIWAQYRSKHGTGTPRDPSDKASLIDALQPDDMQLAALLNLVQNQGKRRRRENLSPPPIGPTPAFIAGDEDLRGLVHEGKEIHAVVAYKARHETDLWTAIRAVDAMIRSLA